LTLAVGVALTAIASGSLAAQARQPTPIRQSKLNPETATTRPLTLRDAARDDRWLGIGVREVRWAPDGSVVYFRWNRQPQPGDLAGGDPWFRTDREGRWVEEVPQEAMKDIPGSTLSWSADGQRATWVREGSVYLFDGGAEVATQRVASLERSAEQARMTADGQAIDFEVGEALYRYRISDGAVIVLAVKVTVSDDAKTEAATWLAEQQRELFEHVRRQQERREQVEALRRTAGQPGPQPIPVDASVTVDAIQLSPDGRFVTFRARTPGEGRPTTQYVDYVDETGYSRAREARSKVGEPRDIVRLGILPFDPPRA
jgi:hypothetical protein